MPGPKMSIQACLYISISEQEKRNRALSGCKPLSGIIADHGSSNAL